MSEPETKPERPKIPPEHAPIFRELIEGLLRQVEENQPVEKREEAPPEK